MHFRTSVPMSYCGMIDLLIDCHNSEIVMVCVTCDEGIRYNIPYERQAYLVMGDTAVNYFHCDSPVLLINDHL